MGREEPEPRLLASTTDEEVPVSEYVGEDEVILGTGDGEGEHRRR